VLAEYMQQRRSAHSSSAEPAAATARDADVYTARTSGGLAASSMYESALTGSTLGLATSQWTLSGRSSAAPGARVPASNPQEPAQPCVDAARPTCQVISKGCSTPGTGANRLDPGGGAVQPARASQQVGTAGGQPGGAQQAARGGAADTSAPPAHASDWGGSSGWGEAWGDIDDGKLLDATVYHEVGAAQGPRRGSSGSWTVADGASGGVRTIDGSSGDSGPARSSGAAEPDAPHVHGGPAELSSSLSADLDPCTGQLGNESSGRSASDPGTLAHAPASLEHALPTYSAHDACAGTQEAHVRCAGAAVPAAIVGAADGSAERAACAQLAADRVQTVGSSGSAAEQTASDAEILTGDDAATMSLLRVKFTNTAVTLWPEAVTLAAQLARAVSSGPRKRSPMRNRDADEAQSSQASADEAAVNRQRTSDVASSSDSSSVAALPRCDDDGTSAGMAAEPRAAEAAILPEPALLAIPEDGPAADVQLHASQQPNSEARDQVSPLQASRAHSPPQASPDEHQLEAVHDMQAARALDATMFQDAASQLGASSASQRRRLSESHATSRRYVDARSRRASTDASTRTSITEPQADFMHDVYHAGECVVAVGAPPGDGPYSDRGDAFHVPSEQEQNGIVESEYSSQSGGLAGAVLSDYVGTDGSSGEALARAAEAFVGRLGARYPDSATRVTLTAAQFSLTVQEDARGGSARARRDSVGCRARVVASGVNSQLDLFPPGMGCHARATTAIRHIAAHQAGSTAAAPAASGAQASPQQPSQRRDASAAVQWHPLALYLKHGPVDTRADMLRMLLRVDDDADNGPRQATVSLRLPSLRIRLEQPTVTFLRVRGGPLPCWW
jgi:hypothetical protein